MNGIHKSLPGTCLITGANGIMIVSSDEDERSTIDFSSLEESLYLYTIQSGNRMIAASKFTKDLKES